MQPSWPTPDRTAVSAVLAPAAWKPTESSCLGCSGPMSACPNTQTHCLRRSAQRHICDRISSRIGICTFHKSYGYNRLLLFQRLNHSLDNLSSTRLLIRRNILSSRCQAQLYNFFFSGIQVHTSCKFQSYIFCKCREMDLRSLKSLMIFS